ncbi:methyltransferase domain-containing protein [Sulfitobacter sp. D35]|uniref:class I SAM-dependent methyltransferase n=1 Tax=Sulfitobacter sp. D35 TaxID=3083252 RepID=UPI00296F1856|nr:methyltransferase [Sulfitobacter sp. D35]MDW4497082.1 methyltransferase domain-containing protein [Sulfitobacter sp. D35]
MQDPQDHLSPDDDDLVRRSYKRYFETGHYDRRYPGPNPDMWRRIRGHLGPDAHLIDFGCGSGRYLMQAQGHVARAAGFDVSPAALALVRARAEARGWHDLAVLGPDPAMLSDHVSRHGRADVVICMFGVLGHIAGPADRQAALAQMRGALKPETGRLIVSVPNVKRRFRAEQRRAGSGAYGLVRYERALDGETVELDYQLFDEAGLRRELTEAAFTVRHVGCESVLPENWLLTHRTARQTDRLLSRLCPLRWCYGLYAEASC